MLNRSRDVFSSLHRHEVRYVVIGGIAVVLHGVPRATFDLDILIDANMDNARRLLAALEEAGLGTAVMITAAELLANEVTIFNDRVRIDVQTKTPGLDFDTAWSRRVVMTVQSQEFYVVALEDLLASKRAAGRPKDLEDLRLLEAHLPRV